MNLVAGGVIVGLAPFSTIVAASTVGAVAGVGVAAYMYNDSGDVVEWDYVVEWDWVTEGLIITLGTCAAG